MARALVAVIVLLAVSRPVTAVEAGEGGDGGYAALRQRVVERFAGRTPTQWGERVAGVITHLRPGTNGVALTLDACGTARGKGIDSRLIAFLEREGIPATLFVTGRWIEANPGEFRRLAANPLFEIANHGDRHRPASVAGRSAYGIAGTADVAALIDEIELNARRIQDVTGRRPRFFRSGTAYYDEVAVEVAGVLGHRVAGFSVLGDAGATFSAEQVRRALLAATPGDVVILHMNHPESGTAAGVETAIPMLRARGLRFVTLSEGMGD
ncbi:polysaccharide deacetylase family protein [Geobacter sulfurreducens]|uniref:polysaccharide deacetylase family protein n=1 Tax=Geobacter sulfurreducens TaxID=35554 RepID=UPI002C7174DB|nr:polysaccharide deacetylase family protein [Geobacter sulfurreducens]HML80110.1 polysaccharide deacetylase family protein [Geobacter sulfurreducens]